MASIGNNQRINCSFCPEVFTSNDSLGEHLQICANKTDQCPTCGKRIRRAIFTYHYENQCADADFDSNSARRNFGSTSQEPVVSIKCQFCNQNFHRGARSKHEKFCTRNSNNRSNGYRDADSDDDDRPTADSRVSSSSYNSREKNRQTAQDNIPCEYCNRSISFESYETHSKRCREEFNRPVSSHPDSSSRNRRDTNGDVLCPNCGKGFSQNMIGIHRGFCHPK